MVCRDKRSGYIPLFQIYIIDLDNPIQLARKQITLGGAITAKLELLWLCSQWKLLESSQVTRKNELLMHDGRSPQRRISQMEQRSPDLRL
jgi:hypothetical protein